MCPELSIRTYEACGAAITLIWSTRKPCDELTTASTYQVLLVCALPRVRVTLPLLDAWLVLGGLQLLAQVERLVAIDQLVAHLVAHADARAIDRLDLPVDGPVALGRRGADNLGEHTCGHAGEESTLVLLPPLRDPSQRLRGRAGRSLPQRRAARARPHPAAAPRCGPERHAPGRSQNRRPCGSATGQAPKGSACAAFCSCARAVRSHK